jgi:Transcription antiterminator
MTSNKSWLIFWTRGGTELKTKEKLEKLVKDKNWQDKVERIFVPTQKITKQVKKRVAVDLYDIVIKSLPGKFPIEFVNLISKFQVGFKGKISGGIPYDHEEVGKNTYKLSRLDRGKIQEIFSDLLGRDLYPAILGVEGEEGESLMEKLKSFGFNVERVKSALKVKRYKYKTETKIIEKPIYGGYIFILMEEDQRVIDEITRTISGTRPIRATDPNTGLPTYIHASGEDIRKIEELLQKQEQEAKRKAPFEKGDIVKIVEGTLKGREGKVVDVDLDRGVLTVEIVFFGKPQEIEIELTQAERVNV